MTLLELHAELSETNRHLARIADALDRAVPPGETRPAPPHPLIGLADISRISPERLAQAEADRVNLPVGGATDFSDTLDKAGSGDNGPVPVRPVTRVAASLTGQWDHDDPLDTLEDLDFRDWPNHPGIGR